MKVDFVNLKVQYMSLKQEIDTAIQNIIDNTAFTLGEEVVEFENNFARYCGSEFCVGVSSGTDALHLALLACGVGKGDEVILPVNTFIATAEAVSYCGATPVFVDVDEMTYNLDIKKLEERITVRTKAVIPVHLYGQPCNMESVKKIAQDHKLKVIEDACQAHGSEILLSNEWKRMGAIGDVGCFSFYPGKNLGAYGDGGAIVTNDSEIARMIKLLRNHGEESKYIHSVVGYCDRLHAIQAAVLNVKLKKLDEWNHKRRENAALYNHLLKGTGVTLPYCADNVKHVYHLYVIRADDRDGLMQHLSSNGIFTGIHYPTPVHLQGAYRELGYTAGDFTVAERVSGEIISLPMYPELDQSQIRYVAEQINKYYSHNYAV